MSTSCTVGPKYVRPPVETPPVYKELGPEDRGVWEPAEPKDAALRGKWWEAFHDLQLNVLEEKANLANQNIAEAAASFLAARALVREARAQYFPTVTGGAGITRSRLATFGPYPAGVTFTTYSLPFDAAWEPDLWGRVRHTVAADTFAAQASAAGLENVRLTAQAEIAVDYFHLRTQDALQELLDATVVAYADTVHLAEAQYHAGIGTDEAVAQAEAQLQATEAQDLNLATVRARYEHSIAVLVGQSPSTFSISKQELPADPPVVPAELPSTLLERRPDIAAAERLVAQVNEQIGAANSAFFPNITLSASTGFAGLNFTKWLTWSSWFGLWGPVSSRPFSMPVCAEPRCSSIGLPTSKRSRTTGRSCWQRFRKWKTTWCLCECFHRKSKSRMARWSRPAEALKKPRRAIAAGVRNK
ncbi:MAG TPA: efflux transporter outer membrane subunit [Bryobacteraceae bacterium]